VVVTRRRAKVAITLDTGGGTSGGLGSNGTTTTFTAANQTTAGIATSSNGTSEAAFGKGGDVPWKSSMDSGGGGGGFFGGAGGVQTGIGQGSGGSGYINSSLLSSTSTIAGNTSMPATTGGTETGHRGDGYARITFVG